MSDQSVEEAVKAVATKFKPSNEIDRLKLFFVRRRAKSLAKLHPNWTQEANQPKLRKRLQDELVKVQSFLNKEIGSAASLTTLGPLVTGKGDNKKPRHLDLEATIKLERKLTAVSKSGLRAHLFTRWLRITRIVWRATAIHEDLWAKSPSVDLEIQALSELIDRRLRVIERMVYYVNGAKIKLSARTWKIAKAQGPWKDDQLIRIIEYPMLPKAEFKKFLKDMKDWEAVNGTLLYRAKPPIRFPSDIDQQWNKNPDALNIWAGLRSGNFSAAEVIERMFNPSEDFFQRSWLFCDHTAAAVNLEALRFALLRREGKDDSFNAVAKRNNHSYMFLGPLLGRPGASRLGVLMDDDNDPYFENIAIDIEDLQVGDLLIFWNHQLYDLMSRGAWRNEFSFVVVVDTDQSTGNVLRNKLQLAGLGISTKYYGDMALELANILKDDLESAQKKIEREIKKNPNQTKLFQSNTDTLFRVGGVWALKWAPYGETFDSPGAWWAVIPKKIWGGNWGFKSIDQAVNGIPKTVKNDPNPGQGYNSPPISADSILFPLYEPAFGEKNNITNSWNAYLEHRRTSNKAAPKKLNPIKVDGALAPGLYYRGKSFKIPVIRPKIRK